MKKTIKVIITILIIAIICVAAFIIFSKDKTEIKTIKSEKQLLRIYNNEYEDDILDNKLTAAMTMPFSLLYNMSTARYVNYSKGIYDAMGAEVDIASTETRLNTNEIVPTYDAAESTSSKSSKDYSTTNIQVENVDEADIIKTDGDYIYSISDNYVIITNVLDPENIKVEAKIAIDSNCVPEDLILYKDKLVVIAAKVNTPIYSGYRYNNNQDTIVRIYSLEDRSKPRLIKSYEMNQPYYTSRCIDNELYVISCGYLREEDDKILHNYREDNVSKEIPLKNIKYIEGLKTTKQTIISEMDLNDITKRINIDSYLMDVSNAYVSKNSIYLLNQRYDYDNDVPSIKSLFGLLGIIGPFKAEYDDRYTNNYGVKTEIYKFNILKDGKVSYDTKTKTDGKTINQYSLDELNGHLRVALYDNSKGSRVVVFNENLKEIGSSDYVAKGENMYSSRFMGNKAYFVTYRTMDPLFVIDLSNEKNPTVLGELHIPGYSTYLHPYDENHLIGIGMETQETVNRDYSGRVISTSARIIGMKMALFDVTDVNNPIQLSQTIIGDSRTTSAILTNPKALLFSKERQLIAIPVNNYTEDFEISTSGDSNSTMINSYRNYSKPCIGEGYFVYNINLEDGFNLKGVITHEKTNKNKYYYYNTSKLLRGLYIENNLYTVSETAVKVHNLENLEQVSELKIK